MMTVENSSVLKSGVAVGEGGEGGEVGESVVRTTAGIEEVDGGWGKGGPDDVLNLVVWEPKGVMAAGLNTAWDELSEVVEEDSVVDDSVVACDPVIEWSEDGSSEVAFN